MIESCTTTRSSFEKLGRNDLCPCGSARRFQELLPTIGSLRRVRPELLPTGLGARACGRWGCSNSPPGRHVAGGGGGGEFPPSSSWLSPTTHTGRAPPRSPSCRLPPWLAGLPAPILAGWLGCCSGRPTPAPLRPSGSPIAVLAGSPIAVLGWLASSRSGRRTSQPASQSVSGAGQDGGSIEPGEHGGSQPERQRSQPASQSVS